MRRLFALCRNARAIAAVEFALIVPILLAMVIGASQLGVLFFANAGLRSAVNEGARLATIWPRPTDSQIQTMIASKRFGLDTRYLSTPTITTGTDSGASYIEIRATYAVPLNFVFYKPAPITLVEVRRAYVQPTS